MVVLLMMLLLFKPNTLQCFVCPKRIWPEVLYAFRSDFSSLLLCKRLTSRFLSRPCLLMDWVTLEASLVLLMLWRKAVDRKGASGALGRYAFPG